jgi:SAM-dependent methyltransferase
MKKMLIVLLHVLFFVFLGLPAEQWNQYDVPYVSTPYLVVEEMLRIAKVSKDDILYDLGCGDGRIVITAAKKFGCRGVGIDLDPQRIKESRENAIKEKVENKVTFIQQDFFETDISEATVVTLYLLSSVNLKLRPKLLQDLKPGTRIVSHDFSMGEWEADMEKEVFVGSDRHEVYYWIVPADVAGIWKWTLPESNGRMNYEIEINQKFNQVWAFQNLGSSKRSIKDFKLKGDKLSFTLGRNRDGKEEAMLFKGQVNGENINGYVVLKDGGKNIRKNWKARRLPSKLISKK